MKKFNRRVHRSMGALPPQLSKYADDGDIKNATTRFNDAITQIAMDFHAQLAAGTTPENIKPKSTKIFNMPVQLKYVASGSVGSVYKIQIGDDVFALKINRNSSAGEMYVMPIQARGRNLINKMYMGAVFDYNGRKYSWVLSDYVAHNRDNSFHNAMEKLYYAYLTKGIEITDAHPNNFKDGKLIDQSSFVQRNGKIDDISKLTRVERNIVQKLVYCIRTDDVPAFRDLIGHAVKKHPAVINYMFFAMKFGKSPIFGPDKTDAFSIKIKKFNAIVDAAQRETSNVIYSRPGNFGPSGRL